MPYFRKAAVQKPPSFLYCAGGEISSLYCVGAQRRNGDFYVNGFKRQAFW